MTFGANCNFVVSATVVCFFCSSKARSRKSFCISSLVLTAWLPIISLLLRVYIGLVYFAPIFPQESNVVRLFLAYPFLYDSITQLANMHLERVEKTMNKMLLALYNGEIYPAEQYLPTTEDYKAAHQKHRKYYEDFITKIGSPLDEEFEYIMNEYLNIFSVELSKMFIEGFRLGAKMAIEVFENDNQEAEN